MQYTTVKYVQHIAVQYRTVQVRCSSVQTAVPFVQEYPVRAERTFQQIKINTIFTLPNLSMRGVIVEKYSAFSAQ